MPPCLVLKLSAQRSLKDDHWRQTVKIPNNIVREFLLIPGFRYFQLPNVMNFWLPNLPERPTMSFYLPIYIGPGPNHGTDPVPQAADKSDKPKTKAGKGRKEASPPSVFGILGLTSIMTTATKDPQMASQASPENGGNPHNGTVSTAVAIDKDKNSSHAVKWAIDNLAMNNPHVTLIHVKRRTPCRYLSPYIVLWSPALQFHPVKTNSLGMPSEFFSQLHNVANCLCRWSCGGWTWNRCTWSIRSLPRVLRSQRGKMLSIPWRNHMHTRRYSNGRLTSLWNLDRLKLVSTLFRSKWTR